MSTEKLVITDYLPTNFSVRKHDNMHIWTVKGADMRLDGGSVKVALRYPALRSRDCVLVARLEIAYIKGPSSNGGKTFTCQPFDVTKSGKGAEWINVKANSTDVNVISEAAGLSAIGKKTVQNWAQNNLDEDSKTTASLRLVPADAKSAFEFTTRKNYHPETGVLAKMPIGIDKLKFIGSWSLIDSDSQTVGTWGSSTAAVEVAEDDDLDLSMFGEAPAEISANVPF